MKDSSLRARVGRVYDLVHLALWSLLIAFLLFFALIVLPNVPGRQAKQQAMRMLQNQAEYDAYCRGWGLMPGTRLYAQCFTYLAQFRRSVETQFADNNGPM